MTKVMITLTVEDDNVTDLIYDLNAILEEHEAIEVIEMDQDERAAA